jgi:hypothetical protein
MATAAAHTYQWNNHHDNNTVSEERMTNYESPEVYDDYVLDGCRWMFQRANGFQDEADPYADAFERWQAQMNENCREYQAEVDRRADIILNVLEKIKAFTHEDLVKGYLYSIDEYFGGSMKFATYDQKVSSTLRSLLDRYSLSTPFQPLPDNP